MRTEHKNPRSEQETTFDGACSLLETALSGATRQEILVEVSESNNFEKALQRLRDRMRSNVWITRAHKVGLEGIVKTYDSHTRQDGFHVLHDWDGKADKVNEDIIPVDVLNYVSDQRGTEPLDRTALAILLDYYFLHVLALLALRIWDEGDPDDNLDRLNRLLLDLQGPNGSGQRFADNAETLILIGTSHFELDERGFDKLLARVRTLNQSHRTNVALIHAASMGCHLRFGFEATYARDTLVMRRDNVTDYPWLCFALATLMSEYSRLHDGGIHGIERETIVEAMLNGLSADASAFVGDPPASPSGYEVERAAFSERFCKYRQELVEEFKCYRPSDQMYSPISFYFNFSHNVLKGMVVDALLWGEARDMTLNDLLTARGMPTFVSKETVARTLMGYARSSPDRIRGRLMPVIVYDPPSGLLAFRTTMRSIGE